MTTDRKIDFLIIGQGLAGSILAWLLINRKQKLLIIDQNQAMSASKIAAGIINPASGKRFSIANNTERLLSHATDLYASFSRAFGEQYYFPRPMIRIFKNEPDRSLCLKRLSDPSVVNYFGNELDFSEKTWNLQTSCGGIYQNYCGHLNTRPLLSALTMHFKQLGILRQLDFCWNDLSFDKNGLRWQNHPIRNLISCEGYRGNHSGYFSWLPFQLSKGEIATVKHHLSLPNAIINKGHWLLPMTQQQFRFGANYETTQLDEHPTLQGKNALLDGMNRLLKQPFASEWKNHTAGIRPGTQDKAPFLGTHPQHPRIHIFNGFGSKGALTIPYFGERMVRFLLNSTPLPIEADIKRHYKSYAPG